MNYIPHICGLVTRRQLPNSENPNPLGSGLRQSYRCPVRSALYAATKPKARSPMGFLLCAPPYPSGRVSKRANVVAAPKKAMRLLTSRRAAFSQGPQEQCNRGDAGLAPRKWAHWKSNGDPQGAVACSKVAEVGQITRLACLMVEGNKD